VGLLLCIACSDRSAQKAPDAGAGAGAAAAAVAAQGADETLRIQVDYLPRFINPLVNHDRWCHRIMMYNVFETLVMTNASGGYRPHLAISYEARRKGRVLRFNLRPGVTWHDGTPLTSADVKYTLETVLFAKRTPAPQLQRELAGISAVRTPGPRTVDLVMDQPNYLVLGTLAETPILPAHIYARRGVRNGNVNKLPVGSGPFVAAGRQNKISLVLERNASYWGAMAKISRVILRVIPDPGLALAALRNNEVDVIANLYHGYYPKQIRRGRLKTHYRVLRLHPYRMRLMLFNTRRDPMRDLKVRQATVRLADRQRMIREIRGGLGQLLSAPLWPLGSWYNPTLHPASLDRKAAALLLDAAGWTLHKRRKRRERLGHALRVRILRTRESKEMGSAALILKNELVAAGMQAVVEAGDYGFVRSRIRRADYEIALLGLAPRPQSDLGTWLGDEGPLRLGGAGSTARGELLASMRAAGSSATRQGLGRDLHRLLRDNPPLSVLYAPIELMVVDRRLKGLANNGRWPKLVGLHWPARDDDADRSAERDDDEQTR